MKSFQTTKSNFFQGIRVSRSKTSSHKFWTKERVKLLEFLLRQGKTVTKSVLIISGKEQLANKTLFKELEQLYLKFGKMIIRRGIATDWSRNGELRCDSAPYRRNCREALEEIEQKLGLHKEVVRAVCRTLRKYQEPQIVGRHSYIRPDSSINRRGKMPVGFLKKNAAKNA